MELQKTSFQDIHAILDRMVRESVESKKESKEFKEWRKQSVKEYEERQKKLDEKLAKLSTQISGIGNNLGDVAEDYFYSSISSANTINGIKYDYIDKNKTRQNKGEYDIVLINSERILVIEVKHKLHPNDVIKFHNTQLPSFLKIFPEYKNYAIYGAVAGLTVPRESIKKANELGLYVFTQSQDTDNMLILNPEGFEPKKIA